MYICFSDARVINAYWCIVYCCLPIEQPCWLCRSEVRYRNGIGVSGEQSSSLGCKLVLVSFLRPSVSMSLHESNGADLCCKALKELWAKSALQRTLCRFFRILNRCLHSQESHLLVSVNSLRVGEGGHKQNLKFTGDRPACAVEDPLCSIASRAGGDYKVFARNLLVLRGFFLTVRAVEPRRMGRVS